MPGCVQGDATTDGAYERALGGKRAQLLLTDPPYCLLTRRRRGGDERDKKARKIEHESVRRFEDVREFRAFTRAWLSVALRHIEGSYPLVIWMNLLGRAPVREVAAEFGYGHLWGEFVWAKRTREGNSGEELLRMVETALVLGRAPLAKPSSAAPAVPWAVVAGYDDDGEATRWGSHPNHKPFGVLDPLVRTFSLRDDLILDPFAGSGSIPAAALRLHRRAACLELDPTWAARVSERLASVEAGP